MSLPTGGERGGRGCAMFSPPSTALGGSSPPSPLGAFESQPTITAATAINEMTRALIHSHYARGRGSSREPFTVGQ
jgi:hypothetical protein